jgi:hypothetical protein
MSYTKRQAESEAECIDVLCDHAAAVDALAWVIWEALLQARENPELTPGQAFARGFDVHCKMGSWVNSEEDDDDILLARDAMRRLKEGARE